MLSWVREAQFAPEGPVQMKQVARLLACGALLMSVGGVAFAGVTGDETGPTTTTDTYRHQNVYHDSTNKHRLVKGWAERQLGPTFWDNDWDTNTDQLAALGDAEKRYLDSLTGLKNKTQYFIDLTDRTIATTAHRNSASPFQDSDWKTYDTREDTTETTIRVDGGYLTVTEKTLHVYRERDVYELVADVYDSSPLILDLNGDGKVDTAKNDWRPHAPKFYEANARFFDITGDGTADFTEWVSPGAHDGILVRPENGTVENALQMFGTAGGFSDGFEKLSIVQDANEDGVIEGAELEGLALWVDANSDGLFEPSEMRSLAEFGITRLSTGHKNYVGSFTANGQPFTMWDWWPAVKETRKFRRPTP